MGGDPAPLARVPVPVGKEADRAIAPGLQLARRAYRLQFVGILWLVLGILVAIGIALRPPEGLPPLAAAGILALAFVGYAAFLLGRRTFTTLLESLPLFQAWAGAGLGVDLGATSLVGETALVGVLASPKFRTEVPFRLWRATERYPARLVLDLGEEPRVGEEDRVPLTADTVARREERSESPQSPRGERWEIHRFGKPLCAFSYRLLPRARLLVVENPGLLLPAELESLVRGMTW
jgi:hypothetical protein